MLRYGVLAFLIGIPMSTGHRCGSPINIDTTYDNAEDKKFPDLEFHDYDATFSLNVSFVGAVGLIEGFSSSTTSAYVTGGGLGDEHYYLYSVRAYGGYHEYLSAHSVDGDHESIELMLHHRSTRGTNVILSIFVASERKSCWWGACKSLDSVIAALKAADEEHKPSRVGAFSPASFLPDNRRPFYFYEGTVIGDCGTPAKYFVLKERRKLPEARMDKFRACFENRGGAKVKQERAGLVYSRWL